MMSSRLAALLPAKLLASDLAELGGSALDSGCDTCKRGVSLRTRAWRHAQPTQQAGLLQHTERCAKEAFNLPQ